MFLRNMYLLETSGCTTYGNTYGVPPKASNYSTLDPTGNRLLDLVTCTGKNLRCYNFQIEKSSSSRVIGGAYSVVPTSSDSNYSIPCLVPVVVLGNYGSLGFGKGPQQNYVEYSAFQAVNNNVLTVRECGTGYARCGNTHIILGEGTANDTTPVTLFDYDITNKLFNDKITLNVTRVLGGFSITATNITNETINIRELGLIQCMTYRMSDTEAHQTLNTELAGDFDDTPTSTSVGLYYKMPILVAKVKLTSTPITIPANGSKTFNWTWDIPDIPT